jgi:2,3,4,5-tetrahydropyridine-2-carboxylate N-succinyltransferase
LFNSLNKIIDVTGETPVEMKGYVPARSVIPGSYTKSFPAGDFQVLVR